MDIVQVVVEFVLKIFSADLDKIGIPVAALGALVTLAYGIANSKKGAARDTIQMLNATINTMQVTIDLLRDERDQCKKDCDRLKAKIDNAIC